jgi:hypothetical protein
MLPHQFHQTVSTSISLSYFYLGFLISPSSSSPWQINHFRGSHWRGTFDSASWELQASLWVLWSQKISFVHSLIGPA